MKLNPFSKEENVKQEVDEITSIVNTQKKSVNPKTSLATKKQNDSNKARQALLRRVKSGVPGLDDLMGGGFLPHSVVLVGGKTGSSKTLLCAQFLYKGAVDYNENGIYVTSEQRGSDIADDMLASFGWDFNKLVDEKKLAILEVDPGNIRQLPYLITQLVDEMNAKRVVIDSTSVFSLFFNDVFETRRKLFTIYKILKSLDIVTLFTEEILEDSKLLSRFGVVEFIVDGVILLEFIGMGTKYKRALTVRKMRRTNHSNKIYPFEITSNGVIVKRI